MLQLPRGEGMETVSRSLGMTSASLSPRRDAFLAAGEASLARRPTGGEVLGSERPNARLGGVLLEREVLEAKNAALEVRGPGALWPGGGRGREPHRLAQRRQAHDLARVRRVWRTARVTVHRRRAPPRQVAPRRPGPVSAMPDAALVEAIRAVLATVPFRGEGHRKVRARLHHAGVRSSGLPGRMSQRLSEGGEGRNSRLPAA